MDQPNNLQCTSCQTITTADGHTVWVCENCGEVNQTPANVAPATPVATTPEQTVNPTTIPTATPVADPDTVPTTEVPETADVSTAQAELDQAASQLGNQPIPETPAVPTEVQQPTS